MMPTKIKPYFKHDIYAHNDDKIEVLFEKYKASGYGIYLVIIELLYSLESTKPRININKNRIYRKSYENKEYVCEVIKFMCDANNFDNEIALLEIENDLVGSLRIDIEKSKWAEKTEQCSVNGKRGGEASKKNRQKTIAENNKPSMELIIEYFTQKCVGYKNQIDIKQISENFFYSIVEKNKLSYKWQNNAGSYFANWIAREKVTIIPPTDEELKLIQAKKDKEAIRDAKMKKSAGYKCYLKHKNHTGKMEYNNNEFEVQNENILDPKGYFSPYNPSFEELIVETVNSENNVKFFIGNDQIRSNQ